MTQTILLLSGIVLGCVYRVMSGDVNELVALLRAEAEKQRRRTKLMRGLLYTVAAVGLSTWLAVVITTGHGFPDAVVPIPILLFGTLAVIAHTPKHKALVVELAARKDPRVIGDLIEAAYSREKDVQGLATSALPEMLGIWLSGQAQELEPAQWGMLYGLLDSGRPLELVEAVLIVTRAIGGPESLPYLDSLAKRLAKHRETRWQRLSPKSFEAMADVRLREARRIIDIGPLRDDVPLQINR